MNCQRNMSEIRYLLIGDGSSPHLVKWVRELVKYYNVFLISTQGIHPEITDLLPSGQLVSLDITMKPEGGNLALLFKIPKVFSLIKMIDPAVVNAHYITSYGLLAAVVKQLPYKKYLLVQSAWGTDILVTPFANRFYNLAARYSLNKAQLVTSDSEYMTAVVKKLSRTLVLTFPFGLDKLPGFDPALKQRGFFFSNRILSENYNIDEVLRFFNRIAKDNDQARLVIANDGDLRASLEELSRDLKIEDRIQFRGFIPAAEQEELYQQAEFFISIPTSDSTSVSLLEAMAHGCIPIVSDIPANQEWVRDGKGGIRYSPELNFSSLEEFRSQGARAIEINRKLIFEKAIFPDSMLHFSQYLMKYFEIQG